jgi:hypothetical protein
MSDSTAARQIDEHRKRQQEETRALDDVEAAPPADDAWRYRRDGFPRAFALLGVALGLLMLIVPGLIALRSYRAWRSGARETPTGAWVVSAIAICVMLAILVGALTGAWIAVAAVSILVTPIAAAAFARI